jgi:hypothetical protein
MNHSGEMKAILAAGVLVWAVTIGLLVTDTQFVSAMTDHRIEVPPEPPDCPTHFTDLVGNASGLGTDPVDVVYALGMAELRCDEKFWSAVQYQGKEAARNKQKCEAVEGCSFNESDPLYQYCTGNIAGDCKAHIDDQGNVLYWVCKATGYYDRTGYTCEGTGGGEE